MKLSRLNVLLAALFILLAIQLPHFISSSPSIPKAPSFKAAPLPISKNLPPPNVSALHIFIMDENSKTVLYQKSATTKIYPASTTKMMTALVVLEHFSLDKVITVTRSYPIGQNVGFAPGEQVTVEQLLYALLVQSGNDAAEILAENYDGGRTAFIAAMNQKAADLHLVNTHFVNPSGLDEDNHYSSAVDLVRLADVALRVPEFARIVSTENAIISTHVLTNVNELLGKVAGVIGVKTGYTEGAGQSLVTLVDRDSHPVLLSILGSTNRFADTKLLIDWIYSNFSWKNIPD